MMHQMTHRRDINKMIDNMQRQLHELRRESAYDSNSLTHKAGERLGELGHRARHAYNDTSRNMGWAARRAQNQSAYVADVVRDNPVTASTVTLAAAGLIGLGVWWLVSSDH